MTYSLLPAVIPNDIDELIRVRELAMHTGEGEEPMRTIYEDVDREVAFVYQRTKGLGLALEDRSNMIWKVVEEGSREIVSWLSIRLPSNKGKTLEPEKDPRTVSPPEGTKVELRKRFLNVCHGMFERNGFDPIRDYAINQMVTHPSHQHQGLATRLLRHVLMLESDGDDARWFSVSFPRSQALHSKPEFGFRYVDEEGIDLSDYGGGNETVRAMLFVRSKTGDGRSLEM